ncbi:MAG: GlsB/YeaQ/YmgE family stress response membrane protein [Saprospiraceae bacterium]|nr:GlsB/YeaQ/YmgE family stress response membrane protein [Saprospiraceae bacterium]
MHFLWFILIGAVVGWLAGKLIKGSGFGILGNILVGIAGAFVGKVVFGLLGLGTENLIGEIVTGVAGAVLLLWLITFIRNRN